MYSKVVRCKLFHYFVMLVQRFYFLFLLVSVNVECAKILGVFYVPTRSHYIASSTLMKVLAERGHEVTVMSPFKEPQPPENYTEIYLDGLLRGSKSRSVNYFKEHEPFKMAWSYSSLSTSFLNRTMSHPKFQKLLKQNSTFDVVIVEQFNCDALFYLATHFKAPLIGLSTLDASPFSNKYVGNPTFPSYIPDLYFPFHHMTFWQRIQNMFMYVIKELLFRFETLPAQNEILQYNIPGAPRIEEFMYNSSIVFLNGDLSIHDAVPKVPSMINIGGFHINAPKPLPEDLQELLDNSTSGVIIFSLGASVKSKHMPAEKLQAILSTFSKMNETILWKWEDDNLPGKSSNIHTRKWLPQQDILRHPNVKVFITHGGLLSMMESIYNGKPMLAIPIMTDQHWNTARAEAAGYAKYLEFSKITASSFSEALTELLQNPSYKKTAEKRSSIMRNKPVSARETIVYWVENISKNRGAPHLRVSSIDMPWYQFMMLDVIALLLIPPIIFILCIIFTIKYLVKYYKVRRGKRKLN
ncbi:hypothetical protein WA026_017172 [Henosepilachna vigintioctopunctata]|uniref:UDP-glucuronosyltransferase n=1 Tax=Henosepilachna vigintioctopunctata TaxID=420089 RepID=A0AAW1UQ92_9CUCU